MFSMKVTSVVDHPPSSPMEAMEAIQRSEWDVNEMDIASWHQSQRFWKSSGISIPSYLWVIPVHSLPAREMNEICTHIGQEEAFAKRRNGGLGIICDSTISIP